MSEPMKMPASPGEMWAYVQAMCLSHYKLIDTVKKLFGDEAFDKAEKAVEQEMKDAQIRAQNQDPRVDSLAQKFDGFMEALPNMLKQVAVQTAMALREQGQPAHMRIPDEPIFQQPAEDGNEDRFEIRPDPPRQPQRRVKGVLPNTTKGKRIDDGISTTMAPGSGVPMPMPIGGDSHHDDDGIDDGMH